MVTGFFPSVEMHEDLVYHLLLSPNVTDLQHIDMVPFCGFSLYNTFSLKC